MANTKIVLDRQAKAQTFDLGTTNASEQGLVTIYKGTAATSTVGLDVKGSTNIGGDLNLIGNLNITGAINETSVTSLSVTDLTIRTNKGGTTAGATGAGLQVEGDTAATIAAITYAAGSATKFQIGDGTTQLDIVSTSATQTLTNKTIGGGQISGNIAGNAANVTGTVLVANGGTGATTLTGVLIGNGTGAVTTVTAPSGTIVGTSDTQTLTAKTLTTPKIAQINDITNNKGVIKTTANSAAVNELTFNAAQTAVAPSIQATGTDTNVDLNLLGQGTGVVKSGGVEVVTLSGTQTLSNKTIAGTQISGNISGSAGNVTGTVLVANGGTGAVTLTGLVLGNGTAAMTTVTAPSGTVVGTTDTQTLSAKTLTTPKIAQINDATNNKSVILTTANASAVNQITVNGSQATVAPSIQATGTDTNVDLNLLGQGTGVVKSGGVEVVTLSGTQTLTNKTIAGTQISGNISGNAANVTGTVLVANGGTGLATLTSGSVIIGAGTATPTFVAPGSNGNILTVAGGVWTSAAAGAPSQYMRQDAVTGTQDSSNKVFTLASAVTASTEMITLNGQVLTPGASNDYVVSGTTLTFQAAMTAPASTDVIRAYGVY